jgi:arginine decarboxylase
MTLYRNRIPRDYFVTSGVGESEITVHAGSYHLALRDAGIEMANILTYSSILPGIANEVHKPEHRFIAHGEVMETIMASQSCRYGESATAGIIWGWLVTEDGERYGGLVCEYGGTMPEHDADRHLREMLRELHTNGYEHLRLTEVRTLIRTVVPMKMYGTALAALCFLNHEYPEAGA